MSFNTPRDISRPPLITPSASPPPVSSAARTTTAPPPKRQRFNSVSRSSSLRRSVSAPDSNLDIQKEREASRVRLLDTWSQLAERYSRPLDEDDIVDIRTGQIVKDNGFWRATRQYKFGEVLSPEHQEDTAAEESNDEDGIDELDAFPKEHDFLEDVFARGLHTDHLVLLNTGSGSEDDLEEFLEAEKRRREEYGSDFEEENYAGCGATIESRTSTLSPSPDHCSNDEDDEEEEEEQSFAYDLPSTSSAYEPAEESASDDELDNWEPTEASIVVVAGEVSETSFEDDQSRTEPEVEVVEMPEPASKPTQLKQWTAPTQLHTPPHSHSSIDQPITGCLDIPLSDPPSSPRQPRNPPARRRTRSVSVSPKKSQTQAPKAKALAPPQIQVPEILEITDDEEPELGLSRTVPPISPYPPLLSSLPPIVRARSQALSIIPQVVITTLPSHLKHTKTGSESPSSKPSQGFPTKSTKKSVISEALSKIGSPTKTPNKSTFLKPSPKTSPTKKTTQTPKYPQPAKKAEKRTESKTKTTLCRAQSISHEEDRDSLVDDALSTIPRELSPELGETPVLASKGSAVLRASNSPPRTRKSQKRKRSSSPHDSHTLAQGFENDLQERATSGSRGTTTERACNVSRPQATRSQRKSRRSTPSEDGEDSSPDENVAHRPRHAPRRFASVSATSNVQPSYSHASPSHPPGMYPPVADHRAQQIITSAMQQLAALLWSPPTHSSPAAPMYPYTPAHHRYSSLGPNLMLSTPEHPHPYPFSFDPSFSKATLPPSSPEPPSSPIKPRERRKSLVPRGHSRGRRVSFCVDERDGSHSESGSESSTSDSFRKASGHQRQQKGRPSSPQHTKSKEKSKGKERAVESSGSESEAEGDNEQVEERSANPIRTKSGRGQTPGPEPQSPVASSSSRSRSLNKNRSKSRGKRSGGPNG